MNQARQARQGTKGPPRDESSSMEFRQLGGSGLKVPVLSFGTGTFGGSGEFFKAWGSSDVKEATRLVDICLDAGLNLFDSADVYSHGAAEEVLGQAIRGRREKVLISTKATFAMSDEPNDVGSSRHHIVKSCEDALRRLGTDYIDIFQMHSFDAVTPIEEVLNTLDGLVRAGKVRYLGCSNFSGWHLMKSLAYAERFNLSRYVTHQAYYSLVGRDYEWELMPLGLDQKVGAMVWSPARLGAADGQDPARAIRCRKTAVCVRKTSPRQDRRWTTSISTRSWTRSMRWRRRRTRACRRLRSTGCCNGRRSPT